MNLRGRLSRWAIFTVLPIFFSCEDPNEIGAELNPNINTIATQYREFVLSTTQVFSDSVATSDPNELLVGVYDDPNLGRTKVVSYTQLGVFDSGVGPQDVVSEDAIYDSTRMYIHYKYFFGDDFREPQRIGIHEVRDTLFQRIIYKSNFRTPFDPTPVGEIEFQATAGLDTLLIVKMDDEYGQRLLQYAIDQPLVVSSQPVFQEQIPPIAIVPDDDNDYLMGIEQEVQARDSLRVEESSAIRIFYHLENDVAPNFVRYFDFTIDGLAQYLYVENDRSNTALSSVPGAFEEFLPTDDRRYVHPLTGMNVKVDMAPLWEFIDSLDGFIVNRAQFEISDVEDIGGPDNFVTSLENISLVFTGDNNKIDGASIFTTSNIESVVLEDGSYNNPATSAPLRIDYTPDDLVYRADISNYLQAISDEALTRTPLMIYPLILRINPIDEIRIVDQVIFEADKIKVKLFYTTLQ